jgi:beta-phosphoglucomutase-like phosphatase (HAD superfamily)
MNTPFVIFDFDGVIADTERLHLAALQDVLRPLGVVLDDEEYAARYLGCTDNDLLVALSRDRSLVWSRSEIASLIADKGVRFSALVSGGSVVFPSAIRCVKRLAAAGAALAIASGAFRHEIETILDSAGLRHIFPAIAGAEDYAEGKPSPAPFLEAARKTGRSASDAVAIEDTPWGLTAARAAGCATIAVTHTYPRSRLTADVVIGSLDELDVALVNAALSLR